MQTRQSSLADRSRTTINVDQTLLRAARMVAAATGRSDSEVIEEALHDYLAGPQAAFLLDRLSKVMHTLEQVGRESPHVERPIPNDLHDLVVS